jgi:DNA repair ATPase RecN
MERDDALEAVFKHLEEQASTILREIDEELLKKHSGTDKALMITMQTLVSSMQMFANWNLKLTKRIEAFYDVLDGALRALSQVINRVSELSDLKPELEKMREELEEQKPTVDEIKKAFELKKKWLNENK